MSAQQLRLDIVWELRRLSTEAISVRSADGSFELFLLSGFAGSAEK